VKKWLIVAVIVMFFVASGVIITLVSIISEPTSSGYSDNKSMDGEALVDDESKVDGEELNRWYMELKNLHFSEIGLLNYIDGGEVSAAEVETVVSPLDLDRPQINYHLEGTLTNDFRLLTENEQFKLLERIVIGRPEYYQGYGFHLVSLKLISNSDTYTMTWNTLEKNGESFWLQLEDPWEDVREKLNQ